MKDPEIPGAVELLAEIETRRSKLSQLTSQLNGLLDSLKDVASYSYVDPYYLKKDIATLEAICKDLNESN